MFRPGQVSVFGKSATVLYLCMLMATTACSTISSVTSKITGDEVRTIPDKGMVPLGGKRVPVLNPGGRMYSADADLESQKLAAENPYLNEGIRAPSGQYGSSQYAADGTPAQQGWNGNVYQGTAPSADASGRRAPLENQGMMQQPPTLMAVPVEPMSAAPLPPTAYNETAPVVVPPLAAVAPAQQLPPVALASAPPAYVPPAAMGRDGYPDLAATPVTPVAPNNYNANMNSLAAERELAENMRREMMQDPAHAEPGVAMAAPAPQPKSDAEFNGWLKGMFNEKEPNVQTKQAAMEAPRPAPASAYIPPSPVVPEPQMQAGLEPIVLTPPPGAEPGMQMASAAPINSAPALEPITLSPPPSVAGDAGAGWSNQGASEPIALQPPVSVNRNIRLLPDGRYSSRRGASRMAMAR